MAFVPISSFIKGESVHHSVVEYLYSTFPECKSSLYFWDSTVNLPGYRELVLKFSKVYSLDPVDRSEQPVLSTSFGGMLPQKVLYSPPPQVYN